MNGIHADSPNAPDPSRLNDLARIATEEGAAQAQAQAHLASQPQQSLPQHLSQSQNYYNAPSPASYTPQPILSQTQQIQKLFELNPGLQQLQNAANKATEVVEDEEGEELDDEQLANSNAQNRENLKSVHPSPLA
jgi:hypothetical protein